MLHIALKLSVAKLNAQCMHKRVTVTFSFATLILSSKTKKTLYPFLLFARPKFCSKLAESLIRIYIFCCLWKRHFHNPLYEDWQFLRTRAPLRVGEIKKHRTMRMWVMKGMWTRNDKLLRSTSFQPYTQHAEKNVSMLLGNHFYYCYWAFNNNCNVINL